VPNVAGNTPLDKWPHAPTITGITMSPTASSSASSRDFCLAVSPIFPRIPPRGSSFRWVEANPNRPNRLRSLSNYSRHRATLDSSREREIERSLAASRDNRAIFTRAARDFYRVANLLAGKALLPIVFPAVSVKGGLLPGAHDNLDELLGV